MPKKTSSLLTLRTPHSESGWLLSKDLSSKMREYITKSVPSFSIGGSTTTTIGSVTFTPSGYSTSGTGSTFSPLWPSQPVPGKVYHDMESGKCRHFIVIDDDHVLYFTQWKSKKKLWRGAEMPTHYRVHAAIECPAVFTSWTPPK